MSEQDESGQVQAPSAPVLDELGQAFEELYHAVARRTKAEDAKGAIEQEAQDAEQAHRDAWDKLQNLTQGKVQVAP